MYKILSSVCAYKCDSNDHKTNGHNKIYIWLYSYLKAMILLSLLFATRTDKAYVAKTC